MIITQIDEAMLAEMKAKDEALLVISFVKDGKAHSIDLGIREEERAMTPAQLCERLLLPSLIPYANQGGARIGGRSRLEFAHRGIPSSERG